jgi:hypothetical protein
LSGIPRDKILQADNETIFKDAAEWLRNNEPDLDKIETPTLRQFADLDDLGFIDTLF